DAATIANNAAMFDALIFSTGAFPVLYRTEDAFTKQAALFRLERAVIDRLRVFDFPFGPGPDVFGRRDLNGHVIDQIHLIQAQQLTSALFTCNHIETKTELQNWLKLPRGNRLRALVII